MLINFDISQTGKNKAGCGYFAHSMILSLIELDPEIQYSLLPTFGDFYLDTSLAIDKKTYIGSNIQYGKRHYSIGEAKEFWTHANIELMLNKPDIIHSNNFWCPTQLSSSKLIYTFYDMGFVIDPSWTTEANRVGCFDGVFRSSIAADWVVAISESSRDHYLSIFPHFPKDRIHVVYPCSRFSDPSALGVRPPSLGDIPAEGFWLSVGTIEPRKNQRMLARAYARYLTMGGTPMPLVLAGGSGWLMDDFREYLGKLDIADQVVMTGYVTDDELIWLYRNCYANLYPSLFEGFGLPVLEGMQFGAPTVTSRISSLPEVAGNAAILLAPDDVEGWARTMVDMNTDRGMRLHLREAGRRKAETFGWRQSAAKLRDLYVEAKAAPKRRPN